MRHLIILPAVTVAAFLAATSSARAADTVLLGGVGSTAERFAADTPAMTLKGGPDDDATFAQAHLVRRFAYGVGWAATHPFGGYFRPWYGGYGFYRPWFYRPWYGGYGFYRPWFYRPWYGYYRPWYGYYRPWYGYYRPWYGISYAYAPFVAVDYGTFGSFNTFPTSAAAVTRLPVAGPSVAVPSGLETLPTPVRLALPPRPGPGPGVTSPVPNPAVPPPVVDALNRVASQPKKKPIYPAYGEAPATPEQRSSSVLVNSTGR